MPAASTSLPLRHPYLEHEAPGTDRLDLRARYFERIGEWPHALSAYLAAQRGSGTSDDRHAAKIERLCARWRIADGDAETAQALSGLDFKRILRAGRELDRVEGQDLQRDALYLREAHRRNPDDQRVQHMLSINYIAWLTQTGAEPELAVGDYLAVDDAAELAKRLEFMVEQRRNITHFLIICPNGSGTWQLRDYIQHLGEVGRARFLVDAHHIQKQRFHPIRRRVLNQGWLAFAHLSRFTNMRFVIAGNLHDPIQALVYRTVRKEWRKHFESLGDTSPEPDSQLVTEKEIATVRQASQDLIGRVSVNSLEDYFKNNYEHPFGLPLDSFQVRHYRRGYFVGFHRNLTFVLHRLSGLESNLADTLDYVLGIDTADRRPPSDFRVTSPPALSQYLRTITDRILVTNTLIERSLNTDFMERYFLPEQLQAMRTRWLERTLDAAARQ